MRGQPVIRGHFLRMVSYLPHVKEPVTKGHLSCRDTFSRILRCPLKTGFTVVILKLQNGHTINEHTIDRRTLNDLYGRIASHDEVWQFHRGI